MDNCFHLLNVVALSYLFPTLPLTSFSVIRSLIGDPYKYNVLPPLPAQLTLTPTPTLYPQPPMSNPDNNCIIPRYAVSSSQEISCA